MGRQTEEERKEEGLGFDASRELIIPLNTLECTNRTDLGLALVNHLNHEKEKLLVTVCFIQVTEVRKHDCTVGQNRVGKTESLKTCFTTASEMGVCSPHTSVSEVLLHTVICTG